jgi:hypothetical protein
VTGSPRRGRGSSRCWGFSTARRRRGLSTPTLRSRSPPGPDAVAAAHPGSSGRAGTPRATPGRGRRRRRRVPTPRRDRPRTRVDHRVRRGHRDPVGDRARGLANLHPADAQLNRRSRSIRTGCGGWPRPRPRVVPSTMPPPRSVAVPASDWVNARPSNWPQPRRPTSPPSMTNADRHPKTPATPTIPAKPATPTIPTPRIRCWCSPTTARAW